MSTLKKQISKIQDKINKNFVESGLLFNELDTIKTAKLALFRNKDLPLELRNLILRYFKKESKLKKDIEKLGIEIKKLLEEKEKKEKELKEYNKKKGLRRL